MHLLTNNMSNKILPLSDETLQRLSLKHPEANQVHYEAMLQVPKRQIQNIVSENTNGNFVKKEARKTKEGSGLLGLDRDNYHRILASSQFFSSPLDPGTSLANFVIQCLCNTNIHLSNSDF